MAKMWRVTKTDHVTGSVRWLRLDRRDLQPEWLEKKHADVFSREEAAALRLALSATFGSIFKCEVAE